MLTGRRFIRCPAFPFLWLQFIKKTLCVRFVGEGDYRAEIIGVIILVFVIPYGKSVLRVIEGVRSLRNLIAFCFFIVAVPAAVIAKIG
jgi:hypothetical protein